MYECIKVIIIFKLILITLNNKRETKIIIDYSIIDKLEYSLLYNVLRVEVIWYVSIEIWNLFDSWKVLYLIAVVWCYPGTEDIPEIIKLC